MEPIERFFGRSYAAEPDVLVEQLSKDEAIRAADTVLLTIPNQLGVAFNAHVLEPFSPRLPRAWVGVDVRSTYLLLFNLGGELLC